MMMNQDLETLDFPFPTVGWSDDAVLLIDQTVLPDRLAWRHCRDIDSLCLAIRELAVRGAPAIGIAAAWGMYMSWHLSMKNGSNLAKAMDQLDADRHILAATRPTAVNLFWALERQWTLALKCRGQGDDAEQIGIALQDEAEYIHQEDIRISRAMGKAGAELLPTKATVLTHCNAGGLATGGYGTALGVIYAAVESGKSISVFADETRPLLQGARLTAWELQARGIPVTVLCEGAAASLLRGGRIDAVITGADRIVRNGDAANKIGTYPLAVMAQRHRVPFYIVAPYSTYDHETMSGQDIEIELRSDGEVLGYRDALSAPVGVSAWNPAFDVTPAELITAIITEKGVMRPPYDRSLKTLTGL
jgi:methylthioribose-1-phosphate isomerase